ncbi:TetR/AcrR family transcriptional regulator [Streptomyces sp. RFCAC02]|uniref:TetR/AcrR family transcriptional regulator n=1 Tax=Streptomyces sp. RFCAC02 TaxID=2499143 RepID=UPI0010220A1F|nr:TetR/AcrR family transcriptional regulator [Streptomyces sp. RFCAC02]
MATEATRRVGGGRAAAKRAAVLAAARELFVVDGIERTSMDAVAARANVSKRTVYDYYGDKKSLFLSVLEDAGTSLLASLRAALDRHLSDAAPIGDLPALEDALTAFAVELGTTVIGSADYAAVFALVSEQRRTVAELQAHPLASLPEEALAERLGHFAGRGLLDAPDPRLAADHFNALTTLLAYSNEPDPTRADPDRVRRSMIDGVRAFVRAYGAR